MDSQLPTVEEVEDVPDPNTNLTPRQKKAIVGTWNLVRQDTKTNGVAFFLEFFQAYPEYQKTFKAFENVPIEDLRQNNKLRAHGIGVLNAISSYVDNLDDIGTLVEILHKTGENHSKHNITYTHFEHLAQVFLGFMEKQLGDHFDSFTKNSWSEALKVINSVIKVGLNKTSDKDAIN